VKKTKKGAKTASQRGAPDWLLARERETLVLWRRKKRAELRALRAAFEKYRNGCDIAP